MGYVTTSQLRPLLEKNKSVGGTCSWGYPIALFVKKGPLSFLLSKPSELPELFNFLGIEKFEVSDWLQPIERSRRKSGPQTKDRESQRRTEEKSE